jgi:hypothetical protein
MGKVLDTNILHIARNALLVAGQEMGAEGDHWPVIKATVHGIAREYDQLQAERRVSAELKKHIAGALEEYERIVAASPEDLARDLRPIVRDMWDVFHARFDPVDEDLEQLSFELPETADAQPMQAKPFSSWARAANILQELGEDDDNR